MNKMVSCIVRFFGNIRLMFQGNYVFDDPELSRIRTEVMDGIDDVIDGIGSDKKNIALDRRMLKRDMDKVWKDFDKVLKSK